MDNISILPKDQCYGCFACAQACPQACISPQIDNEGFYYPVIDNTSCINCGLCLNSCPALTQQNFKQHLPNPLFFGSINNNDKVRFNSSSGGTFSILVDFILSKNGVIFGAKFDFEELSVLISSGRSKTETLGMQKSKYVQSHTQDTYGEVKKLLKKGEYVLYSGTPCQIAGLYGFLKKDYSNLYTVDIICHGVPSPGLFKNLFSRLQEKISGGNQQN